MPSVTVDLSSLESEISDAEARLAELKAVYKWLNARLEVPAAAKMAEGPHVGQALRSGQLIRQPSAQISEHVPVQISAWVEALQDYREAQGFGRVSTLDHLKVHEAASRVLCEFNHGLSLSGLTEVLLKRGYGANLANLKNALSTALTRHTEMFEKADDGKWHCRSDWRDVPANDENAS